MRVTGEVYHKNSPVIGADALLERYIHPNHLEQPTCLIPSRCFPPIKCQKRDEQYCRHSYA